MTRFGYLFVVVMILSWAVLLLLEYDPRFYEWSVVVSTAWPLTTVVFALGALIRKKWKAFATFCMLLIVLIAIDVGSFSYRTNNACSPNGHILRSDADAIEVAKKIATKGFGNFSQEFGSGTDVADAMNQTDECCDVTRYRNIYGVVVWDVRLMANKGTESFLANMELSNCGELFFGTKFEMIIPRRAGYVGK